MRERTQLQGKIGDYETLENGLNDNTGLLEMAEGDAGVAADAEAALLAPRFPPVAGDKNGLPDQVREI